MLSAALGEGSGVAWVSSCQLGTYDDGRAASGRFGNSEERKDGRGLLLSWSCRLYAAGAAGSAPEPGMAATNTEVRAAAARAHGRAKRRCWGIVNVVSVESVGSVGSDGC